MKNKYGAFYTPKAVAQILADWAIVDSDNKILDPSFGGCSFLKASISRLVTLGSTHPENQIFGVDLDPEARKYLQDFIENGASEQQFLTEDFFHVGIEWLKDGLHFDAVVGNPPYVRYHDLPNSMEKKAVARLAYFNMKISRRASYWAHFLLYSMRFLKTDGRLAMILPGAFLHTDYSEQVRDLFVNYFEHVDIVLLEERIFNGTEEESVIVLASGARKEHKGIHINVATTVEDLKNKISALGSSNNYYTANGDRMWLKKILPRESVEVYDELTSNRDFLKLGDRIDTRIGVVTGNNNYFILSEKEQQLYDISANFLKPIIRRATQLKPLILNDSMLTSQITASTKYLLLDIEEQKILPSSIEKYLDLGRVQNVHRGRKCRDRRTWYAVPNTFVPPAVIPIMSASWPHLVINNSSFTCTNNILRLFWKEEKEDFNWIRIALGTLSSFGQLSAELVGRSYGGGVLKLEPNELANLTVPLLPVEVASELMDEVNVLLQKGKKIEATRLVDQALVETVGVFKPQILATIRQARNQLFIRRRQHRNDVKKILS